MGSLFSSFISKYSLNFCLEFYKFCFYDVSITKMKPLEKPTKVLIEALEGCLEPISVMIILLFR